MILKSIICLSLFSIICCHCVLDMRLDYLSAIDAQKSALKMYKEVLSDVKYSISKTKETNIFPLITDDLNTNVLKQDISIKINELKFNINNFLELFCTRIYNPLYLEELTNKNWESSYPFYYTRANAANNVIGEFSKYNTLIEKISYLEFNSNSNDQSNKDFNTYLMLSKVASLVRASECLLNYTRYDPTDVNYEKISYDISDRMNTILDYLRETNSRGAQLDSFTPLKCFYYNPDKNTKFNHFTEFYLVYPEMQGTLYNLFFLESFRLSNFIADSLGKKKNDVTFRINLLLELCYNLRNIHDLGFIHKNIKLENIYYKIVRNNNPSFPDKLKISIGDFSESGIDDYDARVESSFYIAPDEGTELGPSMDIYQLGLMMVQLFYMIPSEKTSDMTLSKLVKLTKSNVIINSHKTGPLPLFEKIMTDVEKKDRSNYEEYKGYFSNQAFFCIYDIFDTIRYYMINEDKVYKDDYVTDIYRAFYYNRPSDLNATNFKKLYLNPKFKNIFTSVFFNIYGMTYSCFGRNNITQSMKDLIKNLLHPEVKIRIEIQDVIDILYDIEREVRESKSYNIEYTQYESDKIVKTPHSSVIKKRETIKKIIL